MTSQEAKQLTMESVEQKIKTVDETILVMAKAGYNFATFSRSKYDEPFIEAMKEKYTSLGYNVKLGEITIELNW
jgi:hypothetical protein